MVLLLYGEKWHEGENAGSVPRLPLLRGSDKWAEWAIFFLLRCSSLSKQGVTRRRAFCICMLLPSYFCLKARLSLGGKECASGPRQALVLSSVLLLERGSSGMFPTAVRRSPIKGTWRVANSGSPSSSCRRRKGGREECHIGEDESTRGAFR